MLRYKKSISLIVILTFITLSLYGTGMFNPGTVHAFDAPPKDQGHTGPNPPPPDNTNPPPDVCPITGSPVHLKYGNFFYSHEDLSIPGRWFPLQIVRHYNSQDEYEGPFGYGWFFEPFIELVRVKKGDENHVIIRIGNGIRLQFKDNGDGTFTPPPGRYETLIQNVDGSYDYGKGSGICTSCEQKAHFDSGGQLLYLKDANSKQMNFLYDASGKITAITEPSGRQLSFSYGTNNKISMITDPAGRVFMYSYDAQKNLTAYMDPLGNTITYAYDNTHNLTSIIDPLGNVIHSMSYDNQDRLATYTENGGTWQISYYPDQKRTDQRDPKGNTWQYYYNDTGQCIQKRDPLANNTYYTYDSNLNLISKKDARGYTTSYTYDSKGNILKITDALGKQTIFTYVSGTNLVETETNPMGCVTKYEYDLNGNIIKIIRDYGGSLQNETKFAYDSKGNQTSMTDPLGNTTSYEYDAVGNPTRITDPLGNVTTYAYDAAGNQTAKVDALGYSTTYTYDVLGRSVSTVYADGSTTLVEYDKAGNISAKVDERGNRTEFTYDSWGRLTSQRDALGNTVQSSYDSYGRLLSMTDTRGAITRYSYDAAGRLISQTDAAGNVTTFSYDAAGNQVTRTDPLGRKTSFSYDQKNRLITTTFPDGATVKSEYDAIGQLTASVDELGRRTESRFDALGRLTQMKNALGEVSSFGYDFNNHHTAETNVRGLVSSYTYDASGKRLTSTNPMGETERQIYDAVGSIAATIDPAGTRVDYQYDNRGRLTKLIRADGVTHQKEYSKTGKLTADIDPLGRRTEYVYDSLDRKIRVRNSDGSEVVTTYDANGNILTVTDANGNTVTYSYDLLNRPVSRVDALGASETHQYDTAGNLTRFTDRLGRVVTYTYDQRDRTTKEQWDNGRAITYTYDAAGNILTANTPDSNLTFSYDALNRVVVKDNVGTPGISQVVLNYTYGPGTENRLADSLGGRLEWDFNNAGRVSQIRQRGTAVDKTVSFAYNGTGRITRIDRGGGGRPNTVAAYDSLNRLSTFTHNTVAGYSYQYDNVGNIIKITDNQGQHSYTYDSRDRLLTADHPAPDLPDENYTIDAMGNRITSHIHGSNYNTGVGNRLISDGVFTYTYDANGNVVLQSEIGTTKAVQMSYDHRNNLIRAEKVVGSSTVSTSDYKYDAFDRLIFQSIDGITRSLYYDDSVLVLVTDASGNVKERYLPGPGGQQPDLWLAEEVGGTARWYLPDQVDTVRDIVDDSGSVLNHLSVDSFGRVLQQTNSNATPGFIFWGKRSDEFLHLSIAFDTEYDPAVSRLIQENRRRDDGINAYRPIENPLGQTFSFSSFSVIDFQCGGAGSSCNYTTGIYGLVYNDNTCCDQNCTLKHEADHKILKGPCCIKLSIKYNACKDPVCKIKLDNDYVQWSNKLRPYSECRAYKVGKSCREFQQVARLCFICPFKPPSGWAQCCQDLKDQIKRDNAEISTNCPGTNIPCPF